MTFREDRPHRRPWWRPKRYELVPEIVLVVGLMLFLADETDAATSAFKSYRAVGIMGAALVGWIVARVALARYLPFRLVRTVLFGLGALGALAVVVLPAYRNEKVVEAFPLASVTDAPATPTPTVPETVAPVGLPVDTPDHNPTATMPQATSTAPQAPVRLRSGSFIGIDHRASGTVSIYRTPDGRHIVGLEEFDIQPGPDYDVYVVPGSDRHDRDDGSRLDDLRGNQGTQYYEVPSDANIDDGEWTVLIWCQTFGVPVANATPT